MTVDSGGMDMYRTKRAKLGADPLNPTADVEALWARVSNSRMAISKLLMDQVRYD
jgi:formamidopyrimidine-DNA glycosylase